MAELNNSGTGQWSETDANYTSPPPDGAPIGTFPNQAEGIWRAIMGALKRFWDRVNGAVTTTGSAGAYVYTPANTGFPTAYVQGETYVWRANFTSVGGDTLNINGLGAKPLYKALSSGLTAVLAGDIYNGQIVHAAYDGNLSGGTGGFQIVGGAAVAATSQSVSSQAAGNFLIGSANANTLYVVSGTKAIGTLPDASAAGVPVGYRVGIKNQSDGLDVTFARAGTDAIDGQTSFRVPGRATVWVIKDSNGSWSVEKEPAHMVGEVIDWASDTLPSGGWAWVNGQALNRTTYSGLYTVWGTLYGTGDGSTTFDVRDDRGRLKAGNDAMGGATAANRLTAAGSGITGSTTGASGGAETVTLTTAQIPAHNHGVSDPGHGHGVNDPGHQHNTTLTETTQVSGILEARLPSGGGSNYGSEAYGTDRQATGISIQGAGTGIGIQNNGGGGAHQNTQPTIISNYIVKT